MLSPRRDSNSWPLVYETSALTTELRRPAWRAPPNITLTKTHQKECVFEWKRISVDRWKKKKKMKTLLWSKIFCFLFVETKTLTQIVVESQLENINFEDCFLLKWQQLAFSGFVVLSKFSGMSIEFFHPMHFVEVMHWNLCWIFSFRFNWSPFYVFFKLIYLLFQFIYS